MIRIEKNEQGYRVDAVGSKMALLDELVEVAASLQIRMMGKEKLSQEQVQMTAMLFGLAVAEAMVKKVDGSGESEIVDLQESSEGRPVQ